MMARTNGSENENGKSDDEVILRVKQRTISGNSTNKNDSDNRQSNDTIYFIRSYSSRNQQHEENSEKDAAREFERIRSLLGNNDLNILRYDASSVLVPSTALAGDYPSSKNIRARSVSMPSPFKQDSFLRRSFHSLWGKSFNRGSSTKHSLRNGSGSGGGGSSSGGSGSERMKKSSKKSRSDNEEGVKHHKVAKSKSFSEKCSAVQEEEDIAVQLHRSNSSSSSCPSTRSTNSVGFGNRSAPCTPMAPLQGQSEAHGQNIISLNAITRSPSHHSTTGKLDSKSLKQLSAPVTASAARSISPYHQKLSSSSSKNDIPEKEKKRKELSSSRQKKFHRHFQQVSKDERVINYYSCALVSDILLQGHLYITENYFAFYSNVFGFVTKLLIPTASVVRISKEKTAKIIPNAVGVATVDERHVFASFMSREAAFRLMCSLCQPLEPVEIIAKVPDVEVSEECSVEDDSSCSISGNESPPQIADSTSDASQSLRQRTVLGTYVSPPDVDDDKVKTDIPIEVQLIATGAISSTSTPVKISKSPPPRIVSSRTFKLKFPTDFHIVYLGVVLTIVLALFSGFLLYRILDIEAKNKNHSNFNFKWGSGNDVDVYEEALKWQKEMQSKSTEEAQVILNTNLEQIARVRKNLETLSLLIHDKNLPSSQYDSMTSGHGANDKESYSNGQDYREAT